MGTVERPRGVRVSRVLLIALATFVAGAVLATGVSALLRWIVEDSRPGLTLADVLEGDAPGFEEAAEPSESACGDRRGCVEAVVGDGVAIFRYRTLDLARQAVIFDEGDLYRSDRLVLEFDPEVPLDERYPLRQHVEGLWTSSGD